jgi:hypothetical protein
MGCRNCDDGKCTGRCETDEKKAKKKRKKKKKK